MYSSDTAQGFLGQLQALGFMHTVPMGIVGPHMMAGRSVSAGSLGGIFVLVHVHEGEGKVRVRARARGEGEGEGEDEGDAVSSFP